MHDRQEEMSSEPGQDFKTEGAPVPNTGDLPHSDNDECREAVQGLPHSFATEISCFKNEASNCLPETSLNQELDSVVSAAASADDVAETTPSLNSQSPEQGGEGLTEDKWRFRSTAFIGPACRPQVSRSPTRDMEDKLSEFYKELEQIEPEDKTDVPDKPERPVETEKPLNTTPKEETRLNFNRDHRPYRRPHPYQGPHGDHWHPRRHRQNFLCGPDGGGWGPHYENQWHHSQHFQFYGPNEGPPLQPLNPFYPPDFGPQMKPYYEYPETVPSVRHYEWDQPFPPSPVFTAYDVYDDPNICRGYSDCDYPPYHFEYSQGNGYFRHNEGTWFHSYEQDHFGLNHNISGEHRPQLRHHPSEQHHKEPDFKGICPPGSSLVLILMRGLPGSGKSTFAQELKSSSPHGLILSTDDYFCQGTDYAYNPNLLGDAHEWNQKRAREAMDEGRSPVIIDNTNLQAWEMKPYAKLAVERGYRVDFCEPNTSWRRDPSELEKRNKHGVPRHKIAQMLERFELPMSLDIVLNSQEPSHKGSGCPNTRS